MKLGVDLLLADPKLLGDLKGKRVSLLGNQASMTSDFRHSMDALAEKLNLTSAFGPQHGMRGEKQDNMQETSDYIDSDLKIPIFSLYSETRRPTQKMLDSFDVLLIDLQDVGTRIYTFLTTLFYLVEDCAANQKSLWILDRPNPAGRIIEGTLLEPGWVSFVGGAVGLPMRHGLTLAEAALWYKAHKKIEVDLQIVKMESYHPDREAWPIEMPWVNPSPNASNLSMVRCFPGTVLIEGTNFSEGRGTTRPLEVIGHPEIDGKKVLSQMKKIGPSWLLGCGLRDCNFLPTFQKHAGKVCSGIQIHVEGRVYDLKDFKPYRLTALFLKACHQLYPKLELFRDFHYEYEKERLAFDLINGGPFLRQWILSSENCEAFDKKCLDDEKIWQKERAPYLIY